MYTVTQLHQVDVKICNSGVVKSLNEKTLPSHFSSTTKPLCLVRNAEKKRKRIASDQSQGLDPYVKAVEATKTRAQG